MHRYYDDILNRVAEQPRWFDEVAVPRFGDFTPEAIADIYADRCVLMQIECQRCGKSFDVAMSRSMAAVLEQDYTLWEHVDSLHYGDPPNVRCCAAGPSMNSTSVRVIEAWERDGSRWHRLQQYEISLKENEDANES